MAEYFEKYSKSLEEQLIALCKNKGALGEQFLLVEELDELWCKSAPYYMADAVPEVKDYPTVAIAWACFFGMGVASLWDAAWDAHKDIPELYNYIKEKRGFDNMDEYIMEELLCLEPQQAKQVSDLINDCSTLTLTLLRKEGIEPQSVEAFHLFADTTKIFFNLGVSLELYRMGYKYERVTLN